MKIVAFPVVSTVLTRLVTDLMAVVWMGANLGILDINVIKVYVVIEFFMNLLLFYIKITFNNN